MQGSKVAQEFSAVGGRCIGISSDHSGFTRASCMTVEQAGNADAMRRFQIAADGGTNALKECVAKKHRGNGWRYDEIITGMMDADDFCATEATHVEVPSLFKWRFVMVSDAGYAGARGPGTSLAMAGANVLAGNANNNKGDLAAALRAYDERMQPVIDDLQKSPRPVLKSSRRSPRVRIRNAASAFICWTKDLQWLQRFFSGAFADSEKFKLPDYTWTGDAELHWAQKGLMIAKGLSS